MNVFPPIFVLLYIQCSLATVSEGESLIPSTVLLS
jgi:hypothetical protein